MKTISVVNTNARTPGKRGIRKKVSILDLERTLLDMLTMDEDVDFCEAQELVEDFATYEDLVEMIWQLENGETTVQEIFARYGF